MTASRGRWRVAFLVGFALIWGVLFAAGELDGGRVRFGLVALAVTLAVAVGWETFVFGTPRRAVLVALGFGRPEPAALRAGVVVAALIAAGYLAHAHWVHPLALLSHWPWIALGLFAYHGLCEEMAWRGYALRHLRAGRPWAAAVAWTMPLVALTHLPIVFESGPVVGGAALLVAAVTCWPLAHLWESGGRTVWAPALVHAAIDLFKLVEPPSGDARLSFSLAVSAAALSLPLLAFALVRRPPVPGK